MKNKYRKKLSPTFTRKPTQKKHGHGKYNWGKILDTQLTMEDKPTEDNVPKSTHVK